MWAMIEAASASSWAAVGAAGRQPRGLPRGRGGTMELARAWLSARAVGRFTAAQGAFAQGAKLPLLAVPLEAAPKAPGATIVLVDSARSALALHGPRRLGMDWYTQLGLHVVTTP